MGDLLYIVVVIAFLALMFGLLVLCDRTLEAGERDASRARGRALAPEQSVRSERRPRSST
jgi:hypothetical protein